MKSKLRFPFVTDDSELFHLWRGIHDDEYLSNTSVSGIWTEGQNIHTDGGIFCPECLKNTFYSWMYLTCRKCNYKRPVGELNLK